MAAMAAQVAAHGVSGGKEAERHTHAGHLVHRALAAASAAEVTVERSHGTRVPLHLVPTQIPSLDLSATNYP